MIYIIAERLREGQSWAKEQGIRVGDYRYIGVTDPARLRSIKKDDEVHVLGRWYRRPDFQEVGDDLEWLVVHGFNVKYH